jgi:hypothetical protein
MIEAIFFMLGFLTCWVLCRKRLRESRRAFEAACEQNEMLRERERCHREMLSKVFDGARELRNILGGRATPPASARPNGRHNWGMSIFTSGPSSDRRSRFLERGADGE